MLMIGGRVLGKDNRARDRAALTRLTRSTRCHVTVARPRCCRGQRQLRSRETAGRFAISKCVCWRSSNASVAGSRARPRTVSGRLHLAHAQAGSWRLGPESGGCTLRPVATIRRVRKRACGQVSSSQRARFPPVCSGILRGAFELLRAGLRRLTASLSHRSASPVFVRPPLRQRMSLGSFVLARPGMTRFSGGVEKTILPSQLDPARASAVHFSCRPALRFFGGTGYFAQHFQTTSGSC